MPKGYPNKKPVGRPRGSSTTTKKKATGSKRTKGKRASSASR